MINAKERFESTEMLCHEMVQMSDGVRLATDIYFPPTWRAEPGQWFAEVRDRRLYKKNVPSLLTAGCRDARPNQPPHARRLTG